MKGLIVLIGFILVMVGLFAAPLTSALSSVNCGTTNITFTVHDGNTGAAVVDASVSGPPGSATTSSSGVATIDGWSYGSTASITASNYSPFSQTEYYCPTIGTTESVGVSIYLSPLSNMNTGTTTKTFQSVSSTTVTTTETLTSTITSSGSQSVVTTTSVATSTSYVTSNITVAPLATTITTTNFLGSTYTTTSFVYLSKSQSSPPSYDIGVIIAGIAVLVGGMILPTGKTWLL